MIVEWFMQLFGTVADWALGLFGTLDPPAFIASTASFFSGLATSVAGLGAWIPWAYLGVVGGGVLTYWLVVLTVKAVRWLWGLTPFSGGS